MIEIVRDTAGIPHIYASSSADLHFGLGYAMAEDRLWQMDRLRRRALGRQAEVLGPAYLQADIAHRTIGLPAIAAREADAIDPVTRPLIAAFVAGINRGIEAGPLPPEFGMLGYAPEPFTVACVVAIARGLWWSLNGRIDRLSAAEAARFLPEEWRTAYLTPEGSENTILASPSPLPGAAPPLAAGTDDATGSNNWALSPALTGGAAILAGDPHQPFWVPSTWYEFALHGPEDDAAGCGHPGVPGLWWGSNGTAAWCLTNNMASCRDLYVETVNEAGEYRDGDSWRRFEETTETIKVAGGPDHVLSVRRTVRGPVVNALVPPLAEGGDPPLSLRWVGMEHIDDLRALVNLGRARSWEQFRAALRDWSVAVFNWIYADVDGNIGYQMAGRIPLRPRFTYGYRDGTNPKDAWSGTIPFEQLPHSYNPARGYVASANQRPVPIGGGPMIYGAYSQGHRGTRLDELLPGARDRAASVATQNDVQNVRARNLLPHIIGLLPPEHQVTLLLTDWDARYTLDSPAPTVFETFMFHWQRATAAAHVPARLHDVVVQQTGLGCWLLANPEAPFFPGGTEATASAAAAATLDTLRARLGDDPGGWAWGAVHQAHWKHPVSTAGFDIGPAPVDGGSHTVRNTGGELPPHGAGSGVEYRIVVDFAESDRFLAIQNIGNSGVPGSPHYADQFDPWRRGEYHVVYLRREDVPVESVKRLAPSM